MTRHRASLEDHAVRTVHSSDGAQIGYMTFGDGPGVVAIPGALSKAADYSAFALALGRSHAVHVVERRGRGPSAPQGEEYGIEQECADTLAVMQATGSTLLFGHSYGGLIALETALREPSVSRVAVYEPGVSIGGSIHTGWLPACQRSLENGKPIEAFAIFSIGAGPKPAPAMPVWLMKLLLPFVIGRAQLSRKLQLLATALPEHRVIAELDGTYGRYAGLTASVLLMSGGKNRLSWIDPMMEALRETLPQVDAITFPKLDHFGPDVSGPAVIAEAVRAYFASP